MRRFFGAYERCAQYLRKQLRTIGAIFDKKNIKVFCAFLTSTAVDENGVEFTIHDNKYLKK